MSAKPSSLAPPETLAEVMERILSLEGLARQRRQDLMSAIRQVARLIGGQPADVPADPEALRRGLNILTAAAAGMTKSRWRNVRTLLTAALDLTGAKVARRRRHVDLAPPWLALLERVEAKYERARLSRFLSFASANDVGPDQVDDRTVADFAENLKRKSLIERQTQIVRDLCLAWNRCADSLPDWPNVRLTVPDRRRAYALPASAYPPSFAADIEAYLAHLAGGSLFDANSRAPASPTTLRDVRLRLFQMAAALVHSGRTPETIRSLADLVAPEAVKAELNFFWTRNGKRKTGQLHNFALGVIKVAKWWVQAPPEQIKALQEIRRTVDPKQTGMTARNRARLRQFDDPENLRRLIDLPEALLKALPRSTSPSYDQAIRVQSALAIAILTIAPMRMRNLASLCLGRHVVQTRVGGVRHVVIPPEEVKNATPLSFEVSEAVGYVLDIYLERYRPRLAGDPTDIFFRRATAPQRPRRNSPSRSSAQFGTRPESISTLTLFDIWRPCCFCVPIRASTRRFGCFSATRT
jgi:hypothetical protein